MRGLKIAGQVFVALGVAVLCLAAWLWVAGHDLTLPAGQLWYTLDKGSLNLTQAIVQRYIYAGLWDSVFVPFLLLRAQTAFAILILGCGAIGAVLIYAATRSPRRGFRR
jgi:hypothetical protein